MPAMAARQAYAEWAAVYDAENAVTTLEDEAVRRLTPPLAGLALLDAACGTARRLATASTQAPRLLAGIDLVFEMIARARHAASAIPSANATVGAGSASDVARRREIPEPAATQTLAVADLAALPYRGRQFDIVWVRLALGHVSELEPAYGEVARVARHGAHVIVSDFHPAAARAGHGRTFRDRDGERRVIEHHVHEIEHHLDAAHAAGLTRSARLECVVDRRVRHFYVDAGRLDLYVEQRGLPLVLVLGFRA
jgi:malonyl-CoA O-methyltransferase